MWDSALDPAEGLPTKGSVTVQGDGLSIERQWVMERPDMEWKPAEGSVRLAWTELAAFGASGSSNHLAIEAVPSVGWYLILELDSRDDRDQWVTVLEQQGVERSLRTDP